MKNKQQLAAPILRITMALIFLYFGINQVYQPDNWTGYIPEQLTNTKIGAENLVVLNGTTEIILGTFLLVGIYTNIAAILLGIHLLGIAITIGFTPLGIRDLGLAITTLIVYLNGPDKYTIDRKYNKEKTVTITRTTH